MTEPTPVGRPVLPELPVWQRVRRFAVPPVMIEACAAARADGDWRAGCAAGRIDVEVDLAEVRRNHGARQAELIEADLVALAPDLLRWHLPRTLGGRTSLATGKRWLLSTREGRIGDDDAILVVRVPWTVDGSQRLRLEVHSARTPQPDWPDLSPVFWSVDHVGGLRAAYGGTPERLPGFEVDGSVRPFEAYPMRVEPADLATRAEVFDRLIAAGDPVAAWAAADVDLDLTPPRGDRPAFDSMTTGLAIPAGFGVEMQRLHDRYGVEQTLIRDGWWMIAEVHRRDSSGVAARLVSSRREPDNTIELAGPIHTRPVDLDLVRHGLLTPAEVHPLVRAVLFPGAGVGPLRDDVDVVREVSVRCRGEWHTVRHGDGRLDALSHPPEEVRREQLLGGLGGQVAGCLTAVAAWRGSAGRLPRPLRELRREVLLRIQHGGSAALAALLDAGLDPRMGDGRGGTLLHHARSLDDPTLVHRLLDGGVPIGAQDRLGRTALHVAVSAGGTPELVRTLLTAGADPHLPDVREYSAADMADYKSFMYNADEDFYDDHRGIPEILQLIEEWIDRSQPAPSC
ncbi:ankyrin repeat domain-containing protein [Micromonospora violae]|uniref:ankyrin repeat domain-containing protein n=1 Tax=Micromonospora violae TaxID=1278207 RepID=UPI00102AF7C0|nr:ankyrin repeat domain-containing protein [Micromonospora violae]